MLHVQLRQQSSTLLDRASDLKSMSFGPRFARLNASRAAKTAEFNVVRSGLWCSAPVPPALPDATILIASEAWPFIFRRNSSEQSTTDAAPSENGHASNSFKGLATTIEFITSSTVIFL